MPQFVLKLKADLENIKNLVPLPDNQWQLDIQNPEGETVTTQDSMLTLRLKYNVLVTRQRSKERDHCEQG